MRFALVLAILGFTLEAGTFRDPQGRFAVPVPEGWTAAAMGPDNVTISNGSSYVMVSVGRMGDPEQTIEGTAGQVGSQWKKFQEVKRGAGSRVYFGVNRNGVQSFLRISAVAKGSYLVTFLASASERDFPVARPAMDEIENGFSTRGGERGPAAGAPYVGLAVRDLESDEARAFGVKETQGVFVGGVAPGGPAAKAGIEKGDVVLAVNGQAMGGGKQFIARVAASRPGDALQLVVIRRGVPSVVRVQVEAKQ